MIYVITAIVIGLLALWLGWTYYTSYNLETPEYQVVDTVDGYEVRQYEPYLVAKVTVSGSFREGINNGFRILAGYIFGGNQSQESIKMTAPVTETESVKIEMTAPVTEQETAGEREVAFVVPSKFTLDTLPVPNDSRVRFDEVPAKKMIVTKFTWYANEGRVERKKKEFLEAVQAAGLTPLAPPMFASYTDPFTFPLLQKHEILIEIE